MTTPIDEYCNALRSLEIYGNENYIKECLPEVTSILVSRVDSNRRTYILCGEQETFLEFYGEGSGHAPTDLFFTVTFMNIVDQLKADGKGDYYEQTLNIAKAIILQRLRLANWEEFETLCECCLSLTPYVDECDRENIDYDVRCTHRESLTDLERVADIALRRAYVAPYPTRGAIGAWSQRHRR